MPPPINITQVDSFHVIKNILKEATNGDYRLTSMNNNVWKVNMPDTESYRSLATVLNAKNIEWYTYEDKNSRPIRIVARGLHPSCLPNEILEDLTSKNLKIIEATNMYRVEKTVNSKEERSVVKQLLPLFTLSFDNSEKIDDIFNIRSIMGMRVRIEPLKKITSIIPQCKKCQAYNHTQKYCMKESRCVKCAGKHDTKSCIIENNIPATCINCKGSHPASYRGCEVAKMLQSQRNTQIKKKNLPKSNTRATVVVNTPRTFESTKILEGVSYANISTNTQTKTNCNDDMKKAFIQIQKSLSAMNIRLDSIHKNIEDVKTRQNVLEKNHFETQENQIRFNEKQKDFNATMNKNILVISQTYKKK